MIANIVYGQEIKLDIQASNSAEELVHSHFSIPSSN